MGSDVDMEGFAGAVALKSAIVTSHCSEIEDFLHSLPDPDTFLDDSLGSGATATSDADNASEELAPGYHRVAAPLRHSDAGPTQLPDDGQHPPSPSAIEPPSPPPQPPAASHPTYTNHLQIADTVRGLPTAFLASPRTPPRKSVFIPDPPLVTMSFISPTATSSASSSPAREQPSHPSADNGDGDDDGGGDDDTDATPPEPQKPYHALLNDGRAAILRILTRFRQHAEVAALVQDLCAARRQLYLADASLRLPCSLPLRTPAAKPTPKPSRVASRPSRPAWRAAGQATAAGPSPGSRYRAIMRSPARRGAEKASPAAEAVEGPMALKAEVFSRLLAQHVARFFLRFLKLEVSLSRYRHAVCDEASDVAAAGAQACQRRVLLAWRRAARAETYGHALAAHRREQARAAAFHTWAARSRRRRSEAAAQARAESFYLMALGKRCLAAWRGCSLARRVLDLCDSVAHCARRAHGFAVWRRAFAARVGRRDAALARSFPRAVLPPPHAAPTGCVGGERTLGARMKGLLRASLARAAEVKRAGGHGLLTHSVMEKLCVFDGEAASARVFRRAAEAAAAAAAAASASGSPLTTDAEAAAEEVLVAVSAAAARNRWHTVRAASSDPSSHSESSRAASPRPLPPPPDSSDADAFAPAPFEARRSASPADSNAANLVHTVVLLDGLEFEVEFVKQIEGGPIRAAEEAAAAAVAMARDGDVSPQSAATVTRVVRSASRSWSPTSQSPCCVVVDDDAEDAVGSVLELADVRSSLQQAEASIAVLGSLRSSAVSVSVADPVFETPSTQRSPPQPLQQRQQQAQPSSAAWQGADEGEDEDEVEGSVTLSPVLTAAAAEGVARVHSWLHGVCRADMGCRVLKKELDYLLRKARFDRGELVSGTLSPDVFPALRRLPLDEALLGVARLSRGRRVFLTWRARCAERRLLQRADALYARKRTAHIFSRMLAVRRRAEGEAAGRAVAVARHDHRVAATAFVLWQRAFLARRRAQARQLSACFLAWRAAAYRGAPQRRMCAAAAARNAARRREPLPSGAERHKLLRRAMRRWRRTARVGAASAAVADRFYAARLEAKSMQYWRLKMEYQALVRRKQEREAWEKEEALRASYRELLQREVFVAWRNHTRFFTVQAPSTLHTFAQMRSAFVVWRRRLQASAARRRGARDATANTTASFLDTSTLGVVSTHAKGPPPQQQQSLKRARRRWAMPEPPQQQEEVVREDADSLCYAEPSLVSEDAEVTAQELSCLSAAAPEATLGSWRSTAVAPSMLLLRESEARRKRMLKEVAGACAASSGGGGGLPPAQAPAPAVPAGGGTDAIQQRMYSVAQSVNEALRQELEDSVNIENRMNVLRARYAPMETVHSRVR